VWEKFRRGVQNKFSNLPDSKRLPHAPQTPCIYARVHTSMYIPTCIYIYIYIYIYIWTYNKSKQANMNNHNTNSEHIELKIARKINN